MRRDSSAVGSNEKLKITTTSSAKNSMELIASLERHSRRRSLLRVDLVRVASALMASPPLLTLGCDGQCGPLQSVHTSRRHAQVARLDGGRQRLPYLYHAIGL